MSDKNNVFQEHGPGLPVYEGRMIDYFDHRPKRYVSGHGNSSVWEETPFGSLRKQIVPQWFVDAADLQNDAARTRVAGFRIAFMDIADPGRQRSFVSAYVPPNNVCGHTVPTITFPGEEWYGPVYLAITNTLVIDFLARQRTTSKHLTFSILDTMPVPRLPREDPRSAWLAKQALKLTCTSQEMVPLWNEMAGHGWCDAWTGPGVPGELVPERRRRLRASIDAYVARNVFELSRTELLRVLASFTQLKGIEEKAHGEFLTEKLVMGAFDQLK